MARWIHRWLVLSSLAACSHQLPAWRIAATCPVQPSGDRHLQFGRTYTVRIDRPLFGDPPDLADVIEGGQVTGQVSLQCLITEVPVDQPRWIGPGGTTTFDRPSANATPLGRVERDTPVHSLAAEGDWHVIAVNGIPAGFVPADTLSSRPADLAMLPDFLTLAFTSGGGDRLVEVLPDLKQKERADPRVADALARVVSSALDAGDRSTAALILEALSHDELTSEPFAATTCRVALSGVAAAWDLGADAETCAGAPALPEGYDVAVDAAGECPRDTELLGEARAGTATAWACYTPDAELLDRPRGEEIDLSYESRLDHVFVRDHHGRIADLIDDSGFARARREGRWTFRALHVVGLGACLEWLDQRGSKTMTYLSCFPPPPTNPTRGRELIKVAATRPGSEPWLKTWTVVRDPKGYILCLTSESKGDEAYRFLPGRIKRTKRWPAACEVTDSVAAKTDD